MVEGYSSIQCWNFVLSKVCKSYYNVSSNANLSVKIKSENLVGITTSVIFHDILRNSFIKKHDSEIMNIQTGTCERHVFMMAPTPKQTEEIRLHQVAANQEIIFPQKKLNYTPLHHTEG